MPRNRYEGVLERWMEELIVQRAWRMGFRGADLEDAQQVVAIELLGFRYDAGRAAGASERTAVTAVIDKTLAMLRRGETRRRTRWERLAEISGIDAGRPEPLDSLADDEVSGLTLDVQAAVERLPPAARRICEALAAGESINGIAQRRGMSWRTVRSQLALIRRAFERAGLDGWMALESAIEDAA